MNNPLLKKFDTLHHTVPFDKIKPEHFVPAIESAMAVGRKEIDQIVNNQNSPDFENTIVALDQSGEQLGELSGLLFNQNSAETSPEIQSIVRELSPKLSEFSNDISLNAALFAKIKSVYDTADKAKLSAEQQTLLDKTYRQFIRSGANLNDKAKDEYRTITKELSELTVKFGENVLAETNAYILHITNRSDLSGLSGDLIQAAEEEAHHRNLEGWVFTLQHPSIIPFLKYADNRDLRKEMIVASNTRGLNGNENDNREIVNRIVNLRMRKAQLLGFTDHASFILAERMAEDPDKVNNFLNELLEASMPFARSEVETVKEFAKTLGADFELQSWDWTYYSEKLKKKLYDINDEDTRPYFKLDNVINGVFDLAYLLYGLTFRANKSIPVYHKDVEAYEVFDEEDKFLAVLYMDYFPRPGKRQGAWMTEYRQQYIKEGKDMRPHVSLVFNFSKPTKKIPSLLTYDEVRTTLHEFGHALHGMLSRVNYRSLSGTSVYRDFVELPSQIMENWAEEKDWLNRVTGHYITSEKMPGEMVHKIIESRNFNNGYFTVRQLSFGFIDMKWHSLKKDFTGEIIRFEQDVVSNTRLFPHIDGTAISTTFGHIFSGGYAAGYYGYKWAEVLDADAFSLFKERGIFDQETAQSFRENILSKGGTEHPMVLYKRFRGYEPSIKPLLERSGFAF